jgi:hypothetical protein
VTVFFFPSSLSPSQFQSQPLYIFNATLQFFFLLDLIPVFFIAIFYFNYPWNLNFLSI